MRLADGDTSRGTCGNGVCARIVATGDNGGGVGGVRNGCASAARNGAAISATAGSRGRVTQISGAGARQVCGAIGRSEKPHSSNACTPRARPSAQTLTCAALQLRTGTRGVTRARRR